MACSLWRSTAVYLKDSWHSAHAFPSFWLSTRCTSIFGEFRPCCLLALRCSQYGTSGALEHFPPFLLTELASVPAWQFAEGYAQLHGCLLGPTGRKPQGDVLSTAFSKGRVQRACLPYKHKACLGRAWDVSVRSAFRKSKVSLSLSLSHVAAMRLHYVVLVQVGQLHLEGQELGRAAAPSAYSRHRAQAQHT